MKIELVRGKYYWIRYKEGETPFIGRCGESWGKTVFYTDGKADAVEIERVVVLEPVREYEEHE